MTFTPEQIRNGEATGADLTGVKLRSADLTGAKLRRVKLRFAKLEGADLSMAAIDSSDLRNANLIGANLYGADLRGSNLSFANLDNANLHFVNLSSAKLSGASGIQWAQVGPLGHLGGLLTAVRQPWGSDGDIQMILHADFFCGTAQEFIDRCNAREWDPGVDWCWDDVPDEQMRDECLSAVQYLMNHRAFK